ncbi:uncharacterized protein LOC143553019 [Bidens hawaiensis]|uniref:uncharacterized protein LOC143553019 n=1 Tax=Bidens hawaiensis TaxID=980011 RepID=UPI004049CA74
MSNSTGSEQHSIGEEHEDGVSSSKLASRVWDYFGPFSVGPDGAKIVSCNACPRKFKTRSKWGTSNMIRHIHKCFDLDGPVPPKELPQKKNRGRSPKLPAEEPITLQQGGPEVIVDSDDQTLSQLTGLKRSVSSCPDHHDEPPSQSTATSPGLDHHDESPSQLTVTGPGPAPNQLDEPQSEPTVTGPSPAPGPDHHDEPPNQPTGPGPAPDDHDELVGTTIDYQQDWPFIKRSPIWATIESLEIYQTSPQRPHFSPLKKVKADRREGLAIAHMVTFMNMVQMLSTLQLTDPVDPINNGLEILTDLETHGFDVDVIRGRFNKILSLKPKASQQTIKLKEVEEELEKCNAEKCVEEKKINELEMKIKELHERMAQKVALNKVRDEEMMALQSNMKLVSKQIADCELAFKELAATPF